MIKRNRDFVALFNALWYRDFPVIPGHEDIGRRAVWTTHIASAVKQAADLMGLFTCFESGGRTDAVIQDANKKTWAKVEWEWSQPKNDDVNEFGKLAEASGDADALIYIGYSRTEHHQENLAKIAREWELVDKPLIVFLVFLVCFDYSGRRNFKQLDTYLFQKGAARRLRKQEALPWDVAGSKWEAYAKNISVSL